MDDANTCHADRDGDCRWSGCPQLRDGQPAKSGRHCPLDVEDDANTSSKALIEAVREAADAPKLPDLHKWAGTDAVEDLFDMGLRHKSGVKPYDYLKTWLNMLRPFAYATQDDSWGEMEKLLCIIMRNYVHMIEKAEALHTALQQIEANTSPDRAHADGGEDAAEAPDWKTPELERLACEAQWGYQNPIAQVAFRAGFLLCREYIARFVEQGGDDATAASIRANWLPAFGDDPGPPRKYDFAEVAEAEDMETGPWRSRNPGPSIDAAVYALAVMHALGMTPPGGSLLHPAPTDGGTA